MNRHDVAALDDLMPGFGLSSYVAELGVTSPTVNIDNAGFFAALEEALAGTPLETLRDYLRWHLVRAYASALAPAFENEAFDFYGRELGGQKQMRPRWKRVLDAASQDIGEQVARLYVEAAFSERAKQRCEEMVDHLLAAMGRSIRGAEWMTEATRAEALKKLDGFSYKIGYPGEWRDYAGLSIDRGSHVENRMRSAIFEHERQLGRLGQPVDRAEWAMPAHSVNAYYHPLLNEIAFPAGILQPPFFYADADDAVNYGAIGAVIGHEITHGFDDQGSHFDAEGGLRDWWTAEDRAEFERRAQVLVEQFDGYAVAGDQHVNGRLTLGENIADLGGLSIAFAALRDDSRRGCCPRRRVHAGAALLPLVGDGLAHELHGGVQPAARERRPARTGTLSGQRAALEPAGLRGCVRHHRGCAHGARPRAEGAHLVATGEDPEAGIPHVRPSALRRRTCPGVGLSRLTGTRDRGGRWTSSARRRASNTNG